MWDTIWCGQPQHLLDCPRVVTDKPASLNVLDWVDGTEECQEFAMAVVEREQDSGTRSSGVAANEAETCRELVRPRLERAGRDAARRNFDSEQVAVTDGDVVAESDERPLRDDLQQVRGYADVLVLKFAYDARCPEAIGSAAFSGPQRETAYNSTYQEMF
jgi:hypothetical protein